MKDWDIWNRKPLCIVMSLRALIWRGLMIKKFVISWVIKSMFLKLLSQGDLSMPVIASDLSFSVEPPASGITLFWINLLNKTITDMFIDCDAYVNSLLFIKSGPEALIYIQCIMFTFTRSWKSYFRQFDRFFLRRVTD